MSIRARPEARMVLSGTGQHAPEIVIKDRVETGEVCIRYMPTEDVADLLTKPL